MYRPVSDNERAEFPTLSRRDDTLRRMYWEYGWPGEDFQCHREECMAAIRDADEYA